MKNVFLSWLRSRLTAMVMILGVFACFLLVLGLAGFINSVTAYAFILSSVFCLAVAAYDFIRYFKLHTALEIMKKKITVSTEEFPPSRDLIAEDYSELIQILSSELEHRIFDANLNYRDLVDYYTLWVHQVKTPIAAMRLLMQTNPSEENAELETELLRIEQYVDMVLSYLRIDSNSTDFLFKEYSIDDIIKPILRKDARLFIRSKLSLCYEDLNFKVVTDEKWLSFVIEQILSNSIKYTNEGKISIYMQDERDLVIEDTGIGIAPEDLPRVFEKSFTGFNGRDDKKATGLGLYLCKRILKNLGHTIRIGSERGKGTKVVIGFNLS